MRLRASVEIVWEAMALAEQNHGGPATLTVDEIQRWMREMGYERTAPTIRRGLHGLAATGRVRRVGHVGNGAIGWQLEPPGRAKYRLPNEHRRADDAA